MENDITSIEAVFNSTINLTCSAYGNPKPTVNELVKKKNFRRRFFLDCMV
jgi:hypothetical protein